MPFFSSQHHQTTFDNPEVKYFLKQAYIYHFFKWKNHNIIFYLSLLPLVQLLALEPTCPLSQALLATPWLQLDDVRYDRDFVTWDSPPPFIAPLSLQKQKNFCIFLSSEELKFIIGNRKLLKMLCLLISVFKKICPPPLWKWGLSLGSSRSRFWVTD